MFSPTAMPILKLRDQSSAALACFVKATPAESSNQAGVNDFISSLLRRSPSRWDSLLEHLVKAIRRACRGADGFWRSIVDPLHAVCRSCDGRLRSMRVGKTHIVAITDPISLPRHRRKFDQNAPGGKVDLQRSD